MDKVIESSTAISLFIPPIFSSHHQAKVAFVNAHPYQPQNNVPLISNKVYFRKMPDGKYVNRTWVTYNKTDKKVYCSLCMAFTRPNTTLCTEGVKINLKYLYRQLEKHENSITHDNACKAYRWLAAHMCYVKIYVFFRNHIQRFKSM